MSDDMQGQDSERDSELDAALASYAAAEPRVGLEQRVLANLRAEHRLHALRGWRRWRALAALAVAGSIAVVSASLLTQSNVFNPATAPGFGSREDVTTESRTAVAAQSDTGKPAPESRRSPERVRPTELAREAVANHVGASELRETETATEVAPKLERFPAPEPLSEQEKLLVRFVEDDPREAALVAEVRAEQFRLEDEEMKELGDGAERVQPER
jgi:hypothetical protein